MRLEEYQSKKISSPNLFNILGRPEIDGLYDPALGPINKNDSCETCSLIQFDCPGHPGHIELAIPLFNPLLFPIFRKLLNISCLECGNFRLSRNKTEKFINRLKLLDAGELTMALEYEELLEKRKKSPKDTDGVSGEWLTNSQERIEDIEKEILKIIGHDIFREQTGRIVNERKKVVNQFILKSHKKICENCQNIQPKYRFTAADCKIFTKTVFHKVKKFGKDKYDQGSRDIREKYVSALELTESMKKIWEKESDILNLIWSSIQTGPDVPVHRRSDSGIFFLEVLFVPPTRFRPVNIVGELATEHPQNIYYLNILNANQKLLIDRKSVLTTTDIDSILTLQRNVNSLFQNADTTQPSGIKQILEKKQGLFRKNIMGKRVNYAARSVISPDPYIATNEIGIPLYFATSLSYPEPVTSYNFSQMAQAVENGPDVHPGANFIQDEYGNLISLKRYDKNGRQAIAKTLCTISSSVPNGIKQVFRHLRDGDLVLCNRQPTLHKPSIMAHKVRVLSGEKTLRLHYANCSTYNADFDGDEMNVHFPQDEVSRAEAEFIASTDEQYIVPRTGGPIRGLIQDHVVTGVMLTMKDTFLTQEEFQQLIYACTYDINPVDPIELTIPAILKPVRRWTGKQVISAVLNRLTLGKEPLNLESKTKLPDEIWRTISGPKTMGEGTLLISQNELCRGVLEKSQYGASPFGLVHACYELYGSTTAGQLLTTLGRLFTTFLQWRGFTCGMDDLVIKPEADRERRELFREADRASLEVAAKFTEHPISNFEGIRQQLARQLVGNSSESSRLDGMMRQATHGITSRVIKCCLPSGQLKDFPSNNLAMMTTSGAKGSIVNFSQISCLLGQQELEGQRPPLMASGRTLPCFIAYDPSARAGGYIVDRFLTGIRPQEYYFHCMAGREGLVDTAVKTSRSGYLQRCLIKHLETIRVHYDQTVRDDECCVLQFHYGEDSLDPLKTGFLQKFEFHEMNLGRHKETLEERFSYFEKYSPSSPVVSLPSSGDQTVTSKVDLSSYKSALTKHSDIDPVISVYHPGRFVGSVSEEFEHNLTNYIDSHKELKLQKLKEKYFHDQDKMEVDDSKSKKKTKKEEKKHKKEEKNQKKYEKEKIKIEKEEEKWSKDFRKVMYFKYQQSLVAPGEPVGVVGAQSIGEPSTQMTLNTFHLAGRGEANVTLGIPRLREIIMTASQKIKTPSMILPLREKTTSAGDELAMRLHRLTLADILDSLRVEEFLSTETSLSFQARCYNIYLTIDPLSLKSNKLSWQSAQYFLVSIFLKRLVMHINRELKLTRSDPTSFSPKQKGGEGDEGDEIDEDVDEEVKSKKKSLREEEEQEGISVTSFKKNREEKGNYDDDDNDDDELNDDELSGSNINSKSKKKNEDEEDEENEDEEDSDNETKSHEGQKSQEEKDEESEDSDNENDNSEEKRPEKKIKISSNKNRINELVDQIVMWSKGRIADVEFNSTTFELKFTVKIPITKKILIMDTLETLSDQLEVKCVPGIKKCFVNTDTKNKETHVYVQTEGVNLEKTWEHIDIIDANKIYSNDIGAILRSYGVEAAREAIVKEIKGVFDVYGIAVAWHHLYLIADYMTFEGGFKPFNRIGLDVSSSPFLKMTYESTVNFLKTSSLDGSYDSLKTPSSRLVVGRLAEIGSGSFDIYQKLGK